MGRGRLNVVLDSTILVSAFLTEGGVSFEILQQGRAGRFVWCCAEEILHETRRVLVEEERIRKKYHYTQKQVNDFLASIRAVAHMARSLPEVHVIARDPQDNTIVACALATRAHYIVTRDKDLLDLQSYQGIRILSPERFLTLLRQPRGEQSPDQSP